MDLRRIFFRLQPIAHIKKRQRRKKEQDEREQRCNKVQEQRKLDRSEYKWEI